MNMLGSSASASVSRSGSLLEWMPRALFIVTLLGGALLFWIAPRPPLVDLPQHAAQVMLLRDLIDHASAWQSLVRINLFTPYLIGYGLALPLTYVMSISSALKLVLMIAYVGFVMSCVGFRRHLHGDPRLDVLFIPGFFGFAFAWGFYTFLVAAPVGMLFMWLAHRSATQPSFSRGVGVFVAGVALFFCHGLVFLFACGIGAGFALVKPRQIRGKLLALAAFVPLGLLCIVYTLWSHASDPVLGHTIDNVAKVDWGWSDTGGKRLLLFPMMVWGLTKWSAVYLPLFVLMGIAPWLWRDRINPDRAVLVPMIVMGFIWLAVPNLALGTAYLYQRFALFLLPVYALMFVAPKPVAGVKRDRRGFVMQVVIIAGCWIFLANQAVRLHRFAVEIAPLEQLLSRTEPNQRALNLVMDGASDAYWSPFAYQHQALWYQAEKHGFVDPNFAQFLPQIVRFRPAQLPVHASQLDRFPGSFDWKQDNGRLYRYIFVRSAEPLPADYFANGECDVALLAREGKWALYERHACR
ncbi:hypothetical protein [Caballeronia sp. LZ032]|uniref:hypothetical protein n=1 Tax=Caballeronia sp. LZ032 TaxID=3038565 RepID=UPI002857D556|nr:hypothetical protein [Caballeronia sp. LZ032]MDR5878722.1 hypothetical protein [Caballeronia sp. LZ032]